ncbi:iron ABC transporter permease [Roseobacter sp. WL0113]|uniref:Iron ABC transporter permease n=2 Tax=Roseobacter sinensis TaxID=2931391 RepID=A0ABT3BAA0_9RHOB|nr:iron ABC transporter permease [Roseobacter sp. WL0113]MCV3270068.1 iron ABC transporter permease [Roseobacter sp. WL0113]
MGKPSVLACGGLAVLLLSRSIAVSVGAVSVPTNTVRAVLTDKLWPGLVEQSQSHRREAIVCDIRFPRTLLVVMVGAGLAMVGASLQAVARNPLADPHLLGISSGGAFGAISAFLHSGPFLGLLTVPLKTFAAARLATFIVLGVSRLADATRADRLVLAGVAVSFIIGAGANGLISFGDPRASRTVVFWMPDGLGLAQWDWLIILLACGIWPMSRTTELNAMAVGDETAATLSIPAVRSGWNNIEPDCHTGRSIDQGGPTADFGYNRIKVSFWGKFDGSGALGLPPLRSSDGSVTALLLKTAISPTLAGAASARSFRPRVRAGPGQQGGC